MNDLFQKIDKLIQNNERIVVSIDGRCAAGKSTVATMLKERYNATVFHMDDYFLPEEMKTKERLSLPGGNVHYERMIEEVFSRLDSERLSYQKFNCSIQELEPSIQVELSNVVVIEGVYSQQDILRDYYDLNIFMTIDVKIQQERLKKRNPKLYNRFINEWIPLEEMYFKKQNIEYYSDITLTV